MCPVNVQRRRSLKGVLVMKDGIIRSNDDTTKIIYNHEYESYQCEKCKCFMHYEQDYRLCPFCGRAIKNETRDSDKNDW